MGRTANSVWTTTYLDWTRPEGKARDAWALELQGISPMISRGRRMQGWVRAAPEAFGKDALRRRLLDAAFAFVRSLPAK
jgi:hypothetical protein